MAAEWEVIAADPTTGILLFDVRLPADNKTQAIAQSNVAQFVQSHQASFVQRGINPNNIQIIARYAPSGYASEVVPSLFGQQFQPGMQLSTAQQTTLSTESNITNPANSNPTPTQPVGKSTAATPTTSAGTSTGTGALTPVLVIAAALASILALAQH